jgi:hypothetical protein
MKNKQIVYNVGYGILGLTLLSGATLLWNARMTIKTQMAESEEAAKPAEIELTLITPSDCEQCVNGNFFVDEIKKQNVRLLDSETFTADSEEGSVLIDTYGIGRLPAILVKGQYDKQNVQEAFASLGGREQDDALVIEVKQPVYVDLASGETIGFVDVTYLNDSACSDCYDPVNHKLTLENNFGITIRSERTIDARSAKGRALIDQYDIRQIPTVLLSTQAKAYDRLAQAWQQVGSVEQDGTFVFRQNAVLGDVVYKDLETDEIVRPKTSDE